MGAAFAAGAEDTDGDDAGRVRNWRRTGLDAEEEAAVAEAEELIGLVNCRGGATDAVLSDVRGCSDHADGAVCTESGGGAEEAELIALVEVGREAAEDERGLTAEERRLAWEERRNSGAMRWLAAVAWRWVEAELEMVEAELLADGAELRLF